MGPWHFRGGPQILIHLSTQSMPCQGTQWRLNMRISRHLNWPGVLPRATVHADDKQLGVRKSKLRQPVIDDIKWRISNCFEARGLCIFSLLFHVTGFPSWSFGRETLVLLQPLSHQRSATGSSQMAWPHPRNLRPFDGYFVVQGQKYIYICIYIYLYVCIYIYIFCLISIFDFPRGIDQCEEAPRRSTFPKTEWNHQGDGFPQFVFFLSGGITAAQKHSRTVEQRDSTKEDSFLDLWNPKFDPYPLVHPYPPVF